MTTSQTSGSAQAAALTDDYVARFEARTPGSKKLYEEAQKVTPGGIHHNQRFTSPYPVYFKGGKGSRMWDVDGNEYIDLWMGHGDAILGHAPPEVVTRIQAVVAEGLHLGHTLEHEVRLAQKIVELIPSVEQVRFCTSGTEATMYAVRLARAHTRRNIILKLVGGWHGANTDLMVDINPPEFIGAEGRGLLPNLTQYTRAVQLNDIEGTAQVMRAAGDDLAGIILAPVLGGGSLMPGEQDYLQFLRDETSKRGAVLIFDEIVTGFRLGLGGAQAMFGIRPDLTTFGKVVGGGGTIGAIGGRADILELSSVRRDVPKAERVLIGGGTYSATPIAMAAGLTTLEILQEGEKTIYPGIEGAAQRLCEGVQEAFDKTSFNLRAKAVGSLVAFNFLKGPGLTLRNEADLVANTLPPKVLELAARLRNHGVFMYKGGSISTAHSAEDIDFMIEAFAKCAHEMAAAG